MDNTVGNVLNFFTDASKSIGAKMAMIIISIFLLFILDALSAFTYNIQTNHKLNQLRKIIELKEKYSKDTIQLREIMLLEEQILKREHYSTSLLALFDQKVTTEVPSKSLEVDKTVRRPSYNLNIYWMIISSSYGLLMSIIAIVLAPLFASDLFDRSSILGLFAIAIVIGLIVWLITFMAYQIPVIDTSRPYLNYILNFIIHSIFMIAFGAWVNKQNREIEKGSSRQGA